MPSRRARPMVLVAAFFLAICAPCFGGTGDLKKADGRVTLQDRLEALARRARPGLLGVTVLDLRSGDTWAVNASQAYPMMSVFKAPVAAATLSLVDRGKLSLEQPVTISSKDVVGGSAVPSIGSRFHGEHMVFTVRQLLVASVSESDNTAVDALLRTIGGPDVVDAFLRQHGIEGMRVDLGEAGIGNIFEQLDPQGTAPAGETPQQEDLRRKRGYRAYLTDPRNRSTPRAAAAFLGKLQRGELLSPASTRQLLALMEAQTAPRRLRAGLPDGVRFADKCGTSYSLDGVTAAYNDIGILSWPDGRAVVIAAFLTASPASTSERDALFAEIAHEAAKTPAP